jgi:integral membrane sensor domain MASE1
MTERTRLILDAFVLGAVFGAVTGFLIGAWLVDRHWNGWANRWLTSAYRTGRVSSSVAPEE